MNELGKSYLFTVAALLILLGATIGVAYIDLGPFNTVAAMSISALKASLIAFFFMHVRGSSRNIWVAAVAGIFWLGIMLTLAMSDFLTRR
jgi:cytochrome c oxidase subunit 4